MKNKITSYVVLWGLLCTPMMHFAMENSFIVKINRKSPIDQNNSISLSLRAQPSPPLITFTSPEQTTLPNDQPDHTIKRTSSQRSLSVDNQPRKTLEPRTPTSNISSANVSGCQNSPQPQRAISGKELENALELLTNDSFVDSDSEGNQIITILTPKAPTNTPQNRTVALFNLVEKMNKIGS